MSLIKYIQLTRVSGFPPYGIGSTPEITIYDNTCAFLGSNAGNQMVVSYDGGYSWQVRGETTGAYTQYITGMGVNLSGRFVSLGSLSTNNGKSGTGYFTDNTFNTFIQNTSLQKSTRDGIVVTSSNRLLCLSNFGVANNYTLAQSTNDGVTWQTLQNIPLSYAGELNIRKNLAKMHNTNFDLMAPTADGIFYLEKNATTGTHVPITWDYWNTVAVQPVETGGWIAIGGSSYLYSPDGRTWNNANVRSFKDVFPGTWASNVSGLFHTAYATLSGYTNGVTWFMGATGFCVYTQDGVNWNIYKFPNMNSSSYLVNYGGTHQNGNYSVVFINQGTDNNGGFRLTFA